jgi:TorA maturation chaperone TorD
VRLADVCARRAAVYQALVFGFREPTAAYLAALVSGELVAGLREAIAWLGSDAALYEPALAQFAQFAQAVAALSRDATMGDLAVEYARLFTGPGRPAVMCYASQYLGAGEEKPARLNGAAAAFAAGAYQAEGVTPVGVPRELPDHVTIELEFLYHLCRREEESWEADAPDEALRLRRSLDSFLREHASLWLPEFAEAVRAASSSKLYCALAELLETHIYAELGGSVSEPDRPHVG